MAQTISDIQPLNATYNDGVPISVAKNGRTIYLDAVHDLYDALELAQSALSMMIAPDAIKNTTVLNAFALATEAEAKARAALSRARGELPHEEKEG